MKAFLLVFTSLLLFTLTVSQDQEVIDAQANEGGANINLEEMLKMDRSEKDKILACIEILSNKIKKDGRILESTSQMLAGKVDSEIVSQKITGDMLNKCYYSIDESSVATVFSNGVFMEPEFDEDLLAFGEVDYSSYKLLNPNEFQLTPETQILFMKLEQAKTEYISETKNRNERIKNEFHLFGYSIKQLQGKFGFLLAVIVIFSLLGAIFYFLTQVMDSEKKTKAAKKKNK